MVFGVRQILPSIGPISGNKPTEFLQFFVQNKSNFPSGTWRYGGTTAWAPIAKNIDPQISKAIQDFHIIYKLPDNPEIEKQSTGWGIDKLLKRELAFAVSSNDKFTNDELAKEKQKQLMLDKRPVAYDPIVFIVHPSLPVEGLTIKQVLDIYTGKITNWRQVQDGLNLDIIPYSGDSNGGAPQMLKELAGQELDWSRIKQVDDVTDGIKVVAAKRGGIFFASARTTIYHCTVKPLKVGENKNTLVPPYKGKLVSPQQCSEQQHNQLDQEVIRTFKYPKQLIRQLYVVYINEDSLETQAAKAYADLLRTKQGQQLLEDAGYVTLSFSQTRME